MATPTVDLVFGSSDVDEHSATQRLQFYRYSATSVLLFIFESIPHSVILWLLAIGSLTVFGLFLAVIFCSCRITYYAVFRLIVKFIAWNLVKFLFACTRLTGYWEFIDLSLMFILPSPDPFDHHETHLIITPCNTLLLSQLPLTTLQTHLPTSLIHLTSQPITIAPISAEAFRPRRRRSRRIRTSNRTHSTETA